MQKLPEASDRKKRQRLRKEKGPSRQRRKLILVQLWSAELHQNLPVACGNPRGRSKVSRWANLSLVAAVPVNSIPKYKKLQNGPIELQTKTLDLNKLPKATNTSLKLYLPETLLKPQIPNKDTYIPKKRLTHFQHFDWVIQPFQLHSGKIPSHIEWLLNPRIKGKYKNISSSPICYYLLSYNSFWAFLVQGVTSTRPRGVKIE